MINIFVLSFAFFQPLEIVSQFQNGQKTPQYVSLEAASEALTSQLLEALGRQQSEFSVMLHGIASPRYDHMDADLLNLAFEASLKKCSKIKLVADAFQDSIYRETGVRPVDRISQNAMLSFANGMGVSYLVGGSVELQKSGVDSSSHLRRYRLTLFLADVRGEGEVWRGETMLILAKDDPLLVW